MNDSPAKTEASVAGAWTGNVEEPADGRSENDGGLRRRCGGGHCARQQSQGHERRQQRLHRGQLECTRAPDDEDEREDRVLRQVALHAPEC
jgi:hypothetical protein